MTSGHFLQNYEKKYFRRHFNFPAKKSWSIEDCKMDTFYVLVTNEGQQQPASQPDGEQASKKNIF